ncbi:MAG: DUF2231 domain-containing protein, partial [Dehalococcoidia bacterium]
DGAKPMEIWGLPAHPLIVHAVVILVPLAAIGAAATAWRAEWRRWFMVPVVLLALVGAVSSVLAANSGEDLEERVEDRVSETEEERIEDHGEAGEMARNLSLLFGATIVAFSGVALAERQKKALPKALPLATWAVVVVVGLGATIAIISAGHSGAEAVWKERGASGGQHEDDD